jgi:hypothetical protein
MFLERTGTDFMKLTKENKAIFDNAARPLTAQELFAGDEELYKLLDGHMAATDNSSPQSPKKPSAVKALPVTAAAAPKRGLSIITIAIRISNWFWCDGSLGNIPSNMINLAFFRLRDFWYEFFCFFPCCFDLLWRH